MITDDDRCLWLHGAIENLCRAQTEMTDTEASAKLGEAVHLIAEVGRGINPRGGTVTEHPAYGWVIAQGDNQ